MPAGWTAALPAADGPIKLAGDTLDVGADLID